MDIKQLYQCYCSCGAVSTDTRNIIPNALFIALKGENFDANNFALEALEKGAKFALVDDKKFLQEDNENILFCQNGLKALQDLAQYHREQIGLPILALTGSNGKTTTKELIHRILSKKYQTIATLGNLNNHIGVPLTLLNISEETDLAIIEMGANHIGEIEQLCQMTQPDFGYITNFGKAHLEGFKSFDGVIKAKSELYAYLKENHKMVFVNQDDEIQLTQSQDISCFTFSSSNKKSNLFFSKISAQPMAQVQWNNKMFHSNLTGIYNATNMCAAIAIGKYFNIEVDDIYDAISSYIPENNRSQWTQTSKNNILLDAYNANPTSMQAAVENFSILNAENKLLILGDMFELGNDSLKEHQHIISLTENLKSETIFVGSHFKEAKSDKNNSLFFENFEALTKHLEKNQLKNKTILIKGSRGMALERLKTFL